MSNAEWLSRSRAAVWHPCTQMKRHEQLPLVPIRSGSGVYLEDFEGHRYLDGVSSWWVNLFGHAHPRLNAAIIDQLGRLEHVILAGFTHEAVVRLSEQLAALTGLGHAFYGSDGASAVEIALKMSFHYWRNSGKPEKTEFVSLHNSYHGETLGALSVTDVPLFRDTYAPLLRSSHRVMSPDARLAEAGESAEHYAVRAAGDLERLLAQQGSQIAALILEPLLQGATGMGMYHPEYLRRARALCDTYQVHLIADEIATGFGRTGTLFACEQAGGLRDWVPDLICLSKGLTGGYLPLSVVLCTDRLYAAFYDEDIRRGFLHSHSYTGNALACRVALEVLALFAEDHVLASNHAKAQAVAADFARLVQHPQVRYPRQLGMVWAFDVEARHLDFASRYFQAALTRGLLVRPVGTTVYLMPPYVVSTDELRWALGVLESLLLQEVW